MKKIIFSILICLFNIFSEAQELYVMTEPASNMPARSVGIRIGQMIMPPFSNHAENIHHTSNRMRNNAEVMIGLNKKLMFHFSFVSGNYLRNSFQPEALSLYGKYRFLSIDDNHKHFRMAAFGKFAVSNNLIVYDEINLNGDNSGIMGGIVATQLLHKLALNISTSYVNASDNFNQKFPSGLNRQSINYSFSAGYLCYPFVYKNYKEPNFNIYCELLGKRNFQTNENALDISPAIQVIIRSVMKIDLAYRYQLFANMNRMNNREFILKLEYNFFNAF